jgi:hypothetical protein
LAENSNPGKRNLTELQGRSFDKDGQNSRLGNVANHEREDSMRDMIQISEQNA